MRYLFILIVALSLSAKAKEVYLDESELEGLKSSILECLKNTQNHAFKELVGQLDSFLLMRQVLLSNNELVSIDFVDERIATIANNLHSLLPDIEDETWKKIIRRVLRNVQHTNVERELSSQLLFELEFQQ